MKSSFTKNKVAIILGVVCFILTIGIQIQIKSVDSITEKKGISISDNSELMDEVFRQRQAYKDAYNRLEDAEQALEEIREQATANNGHDSYLETQIKNNDKLLGKTEVKGNGVIIRLDDNREINLEEAIVNASDIIVHEGDLLQIVNELFNAEADAISINGKRIVSTTAILCDGNIIRVNDEAIGVPIEIKAIGHPERLYYALNRPQGYLSIMKRDGVIVSTEKKDNIVIPKYEGVYQYDYIKR